MGERDGGLSSTALEVLVKGRLCRCWGRGGLDDVPCLVLGVREHICRPMGSLLLLASGNRPLPTSLLQKSRTCSNTPSFSSSPLTKHSPGLLPGHRAGHRGLSHHSCCARTTNEAL